MEGIVRDILVTYGLSRIPSISLKNRQERLIHSLFFFQYLSSNSEQQYVIFKG